MRVYSYIKKSDLSNINTNCYCIIKILYPYRELVYQDTKGHNELLPIQFDLSYSEFITCLIDEDNGEKLFDKGNKVRCHLELNKIKISKIID
mgnify:CR=1 FL=1